MPGRRVGADGRDGVHELGKTGASHAVGVPEDGDEQSADHHGVGDGVVILRQARRDGPITQRRAAAGSGGGTTRSTRRTTADPLRAPRPRRRRRPRSRSTVSIMAIEGDARGQEASEVAVRLLEVRVERHVVDQVVRVLEHGPLPVIERRHRGPELPQATSSSVGSNIRIARAVSAASVRTPGRSCGRVATGRPSRSRGTTSGRRTVRGSRSRIRCSEQRVPRGDWRIRAGPRASRTPRVPRLTASIGSMPARVDQRDELVEAELVGLGRVPGEIESTGTAVRGPTPSSQSVAGDEVAAGVADDRDAEFAHEVEHVPAEPSASAAGWPGS